MAQANINEVVKNFKKALSEAFAANGYEIHEGTPKLNGILVVKNSVGFFFDFEDQGGGDTVHNLEDDSRTPIIRLVASTFCRLPHLNANQRIILMERVGECAGVIMIKMDGDDYCLKTSSVFINELQMHAIASSALAYFGDADAIIKDFLKTAKVK